MAENKMENRMELLLAASQKKEVGCALACNEMTEQFGLSLTGQEAQELVSYERETLKAERRVEFSESILPQIIRSFCDSSFILQDNYLETLKELQEIFFYYKNESLDLLTDEEILSFMRKEFEEVCFGDLDYLKGTSLEYFAREVRAGNIENPRKRSIL